MSVKPGTLFRAGEAAVVYRERFTPASANLEYLSCGEYALQPGGRSQEVAYPTEEALLFAWRGTTQVEVGCKGYCLAPYDVLYVPKGCQWRMENPSAEPANVVVTRALAQNVHPVQHSVFAELSKLETRIRRLKGKNVYLMFDVSEKADRLVAGYTFFEPYARSWPPHNHTDQEEVYFFIRGHGSMEVYEDAETLSFVHNVEEGDAVTIPFLNYHPVFSQEAPLEFIWAIAGERYWVGDKSKDFMSGAVQSVTT